MYSVLEIRENKACGGVIFEHRFRLKSLKNTSSIGMFYSYSQHSYMYLYNHDMNSIKYIQINLMSGFYLTIYLTK